ncbi:Rz1-like lysis system protein LysC [Marinobacterium sedimentorum]|uniref:Rz1-like lysis system protein LysC n=1 Tax=Marinobacterium sedimentorum TaxID=2927804 RepID=UPI0034CE4842
MLLGGCASAPPSPAPLIISSSCPLMTPCRLPATDPTTNGSLMADIERVEAAWGQCAARVDSIIECQERDREKAAATARLPAR